MVARKKGEVNNKCLNLVYKKIIKKSRRGEKRDIIHVHFLVK